ncbi:MAG: FIST N-terminal domain-containing protein [Verrucomicrobiales bacterium]|nr:FIST N-terminal domain-containing protein [Verrucomicrobiales bacterium]
MTESTKNLSASCLVSSPFDQELIQQAAHACLNKLGSDPDLVVAFVTSDYKPHLKALTESLQIDGHASTIIGGSACGLAGVSREQEHISGISLLFLCMPETDIKIGEDIVSGAIPDAALLLSNPLETTFDSLLEKWDDKFPGCPLVGGNITGGPDEEALFLFNECGEVISGSLLAHFTGGVKVESLVAPGCRPIGNPMVVTEAEGDEVLSLGRREPFDVLEETFSALGEDLQIEAEGNIFAGVVINEQTDEFESGDFRIHQIVSARLEDGRLKLGSPVRAGQTMQFQLRDSLAAEMLLRSECDRIFEASGKPFAALLFMGMGRGKNLFGVEDRNVRTFEETFGKVPLTGIHSFGEVGSASSMTERHDHSICGALFYSKD